MLSAHGLSKIKPKRKERIMDFRRTLLVTGTIVCSITTPSLLTGCVPAVVGGGVTTVGVAATKEKGVAGAWTDTKISTTIKLGLYQKDPDLHRLVDVNVQNGEVLLTGSAPSEEMHLEAVKIAWDCQGVKRVIDNIGGPEGASVGTYARDTWITTQLKSSLLFDGDVQSRNYSVKTVSGQVYLMGIAQNQAELDKVVSHASNTSGVEKVISYVHVKEGTEKDEPGEDEVKKDAAE
jgi:osmotically-inducible protein OsmY